MTYFDCWVICKCPESGRPDTVQSKISSITQFVTHRSKHAKNINKYGVISKCFFLLIRRSLVRVQVGEPKILLKASTYSLLLI